MVSTITTSFVEQYNSDLVYFYENEGFKFKGLTREGMVVGDVVHWNQIGGLVAQAMPARHDEHVFQDVDHQTVNAAMVDTVVPTIIRKLDIMKQNIDERRAQARRHMAAIGREFDARVIAAITADASAEVGPGDTVALTVQHMINLITAFNENEVPDDGRRYAAVSPKTWGRMLQIDEFSNADYVGAENLPFGGQHMTAKRWGGVLWFMENKLAINGTTNVATNLAWHGDAVGHGINANPETIIDWENTRSAWSIVTTFSSGVKTVEPAGTFTWSVDELA